MVRLFTPDYYIKDYRSLNVNRLIERGIKLLVCDVDNTLVAHDIALPDAPVLDFVKKIKEHNIELVLVSNNVEERVRLFAKPLGLAYYPFAQKPLKKTYKKILADYPYKANEIAIMGDQLFTDVLGGNRNHFYTILSAPLAQKDLHFTKINRFIELGVYKILAKRKKLVRGEYDE